jgi:peptide/nickel transport system substrate-binding protein
MRVSEIPLKVLTGLLLTVLIGSAQAFAAKDSLVVADDAPVSNLDWYQNPTRPMANLAYQIWDPLIARDPDDGSLHPNLAISWKLINDTTWEFKLRPGVKFHNGNPLTAESIRYTMENRVLDPQQKAMARGDFSWVKKIEVIDTLTFRVIAEKPYPLVLERFNSFFPYDPAWSKEKGDVYLKTHPMGTGPYKVVSFEDGIKVVLAANENYWQKGIPKIKNLTVRYIPEVSTRLAELISGGVDMALRIPPDQVEIIQQRKHLKVVSKPILRICYWQFDAEGRASSSPLTDVRVRRAIWHAIDRAAILKNVLANYADLLNIPVNPRAFGADPSIKAWAYDPGQAKALLKEAGFEKGFTLDCWIPNDLMYQVSQAAGGYLERCNIKLNFKDYRTNLGQMMQILNSGKLTGIYAMGFGSYGIFDADAVLPWHFVPSASQGVYTDDPRLAQWLLDARSSMDPVKRKELYARAQQRIIDQAYWMPWFVMHEVQGMHQDLEYTIGVDERSRFQSARWLK